MRFRSVSSLGVLGMLLWSTQGQAADTDVRLNSVGFLPGLSKVATIAGGAGATTFSVKREGADTVAFEGSLSATRNETPTVEKIQLADFTALDAPGDYYLEVPGVGRSATFRIGPGSLDEAFRTVMLGFYGWRSGQEIVFDFQGQRFEQAAGHLKDALLDYVDPAKKGVLKDGTGGWYDAGDYGKYTVNGSFTLGMMLQAWEDFGPGLAKITLEVPEKGDGRPDYLDELAYQYKWLFAMQLEDGSVSHKLDSFNFAGFVAPADDVAKRYFSKPGSAATAAFVAAMAKGYRVFLQHDPALAEKMLEAAKKSWKWLVDNPKALNASLQPDFVNAQYTTKDGTYRMWAAVEMWESTGDAKALAEFEERARCEKNKVDAEFDWGTAKNLAMSTYLRSAKTGRKPALVEQVRAATLDAANTNVTNRNASGYGRATNSYYWGSNGVVARTCLVLQTANRIVPDRRYVDTCLDQIGHLFGRNYYDRSQVTGVGINPPLHPHDRRSVAAKKTFPGLLVGGSSKGATGWVDDQDDYTSNEVAINWNGALVYALAGFLSGNEGGPGGGGAPPPDGGVPRGDAAVDARDGGRGDATVPRNDAGDGGSSTVDGGLPTIKPPAADLTGCAPPKPTYPSNDTSGTPSVIDDLEDGDEKITEVEGRVGAWFAFDDATSTAGMLVKDGGHGDGKKSMYVSGSGFESWGGGIGVTLNAPEGEDKQLYDASKFTGISFWAKGTDGYEFSLMVPEERTDPAGGICGGCHDHPTVKFVGTGEWKQYVFTWSQLAQLGFGDEISGIDPKKLFAIQFQWGAGDTKFELWIDEVAFTTAKSGSTTSDAGTVKPTKDAGAKDAGGQGSGSKDDEGEEEVEEDSTSSGSSDGCGCRVPASTAGDQLGLATAVAALGWVARRRRRAR